jgi:hypothetical protein
MDSLSYHPKPNQVLEPTLTDASISTLSPLDTDVAPGGADPSFQPSDAVGVERRVCSDEASRADRQPGQDECQGVGGLPGARLAAACEVSEATSVHVLYSNISTSGKATSVSLIATATSGKATSPQAKPEGRDKRLVDDVGYCSKRELNDILVGSLEEVGRYEESDRVKGCFYEFEEYESICGHESRLLPFKCHNRLCSFCSEERAKRMRERVQVALERCENPKMLTLTFKSVDHISRGYVDYMLECFRKLRRRKFFKGKVKGGVYCFEFTYNPQHGYHPHIHCLIDAGFIDQKEISEVWYEITKDSYVVDIREANNNALEEVVKYLCKNASFVQNPSVVDEFLNATEHQRLIQTFGSFHNFDDAEAFFEDDETKDKGDFWTCGCGCSVGQENWEHRETKVKAEDVRIDKRGRYVNSGRYVVY